MWHEEKFSVLRKLLDQETEGATLVFGRTKHGVRNLGEKLIRLGYAVDVLQGNLSQPQRDRVIKRFREGSTPILVATNVAARGLDVLHIDRVINYELPGDPRALHASCRPYRPHGACGAGDHAAWPGGPAEVA